MKIKSLGLKVSLIVAVMIVIIITIIVIIVSQRSNALVIGLTESEALSANTALAKYIDNLERDALATAGKIAYSPDVVRALLDGDISALASAVSVYCDDLDVATVTDARGVVLTRKHNDITGDNISNSKVVAAVINTGKGISMIYTESVDGLATRGSAPIRDEEGNLIGIIICGHDLSDPKYVDYMKDSNGCETTIFEGKTRLSSTLTGADGNRVVGTDASDAVVDTVINKRQDLVLQLNLFGNDYMAYYSPLISDGDVVGMLFAGVLIDEALAGQQQMMNMVVLVGVLCGIICVVMVIVFSLLSVSRPLKRIGVLAQRISSGDIGIQSKATAETGIRSHDEVGQLARSLEQAYTQLQGYIGEIQARMQGLAGGDLATKSNYSFQGDFVFIKDSINDIIDNFNKIIGEVNHSSAQTSSGASQVADGAQALASGATEQAATLQEISASIADISHKTKENSERTSTAAQLANTIMQSAEKGNNQMEQMISAVNEINQANQNISKVIKAIDDIAFQTNILALNAAVEAARAGSAGKGFAVVAEEVRNLASKSAESAKDTATLIENSIEKAELGTQIAGETATSLKEIVAGISESNSIMSEIALSSEQQTLAIEQINLAIGGVTQVVQQNSATAEESAAASHEMSGQASVLEGLIAQFKLK
jgi:methyl-accepting chemotaxis protein